MRPDNNYERPLVFPRKRMLDKKQLDVLIQGCRENNPTAQNRLYRAFYAWAMTICRRYTSTQEVAYECLQDGFFKVFTKINHYSGELSFEAWLKKVLINTCIDRYRSQVNAIETVAYTSENDESIWPEAFINSDADYLLHLIQQLSPAYRTTLNMYAVEGYEYHEIAQMLQVSIGSVKSNLSKARHGLKQLLQSDQKKSAYER